VFALDKEMDGVIAQVCSTESTVTRGIRGKVVDLGEEGKTVCYTPCHEV